MTLSNSSIAKRILTPFLFSVPLLLMICSCHKGDNDKPTTPVITDSMVINLSDPFQDRNEEIIISEPAGKILLDTMGPFIDKLTATLKTNQILLDFTRIDLDTTSGHYQVTTFRTVDLSHWTTLYQSDYYVPIPSLPATNASIVYQNAPPGFYTGLLIDDYGPGFSYGWRPYPPGSISCTYEQHGQNYLYLLLPLQGLYNFHIPHGLTDTVDLSQMDTAVQVSFKKPSQFKLQPCLLIGFTDTSDYSKSVQLYNGFAGPNTNLPDLEYPTKIVKKFELMVTGTNNTNGSAVFYSYGDTVPTNLPFLDETYYSISSSINTDFEVSFAKTKPTYYGTYWNNSTITWALFTSPDSNTINPIMLLSKFKSRLLQGQDLSSISLKSFQLENTQDMVYGDFFAYEHNTALRNTKRIKSSVSFFKNF